MIPVVTAAQMRAIDRAAIEDFGLPARTLMESAGFAAARQIRKRLRRGESALALCGRGGNGGDGLVAARWLFHWGIETRIVLAAEPGRYEGPAGACLEAARLAGVPIDPPDAPLPDLDRPAWVVDALMGVGAEGAARGRCQQLIKALNRSQARVLSCDLPSGLPGWVAEGGACVQADLTLAVGLPKRELLLYPGAERVGRLLIADIGFPKAAVERTLGRAAERSETRVYLTEARDAAGMLPLRPPNAHKGFFGRAFLLAGSRGMTGAALLAGEAALRVGAGLAVLGVPASCGDIADAQLTEATTAYLPETANGALSMEAEPAVRERIAQADAVAVGPGLSRDPETARLLRSLYASWNGPAALAVDADGLNAAAPLSETGARFPEGCAVTPHTGEMARLMGVSAAEVEARRIEIAAELAREQRICVALKGAPTAVAASDGRVFLNPTGNSGMATGGSGDVLTGALAGLLAQGVPTLEAAVCAAYLHGLAGDTAFRRLGPGMTARDILRFLPAALRRLQRKTEPPEETRRTIS